VMTQQCARTCNRCPNGATSAISSTSSRCSDTNANCEAWVRNGFCTNTFYTAAQRRQYCAKSCNYVRINWKNNTISAIQSSSLSQRPTTSFFMI
jgi:hypothetical protein